MSLPWGAEGPVDRSPDEFGDLPVCPLCDVEMDYIFGVGRFICSDCGDEMVWSAQADQSESAANDLKDTLQLDGPGTDTAAFVRTEAECGECGEKLTGLFGPGRVMCERCAGGEAVFGWDFDEDLDLDESPEVGEAREFNGDGLGGAEATEGSDSSVQTCGECGVDVPDFDFWRANGHRCYACEDAARESGDFEESPGFTLGPNGARIYWGAGSGWSGDGIDWAAATEAFDLAEAEDAGAVGECVVCGGADAPWTGGEFVHADCDGKEPAFAWVHPSDHPELNDSDNRSSWAAPASVFAWSDEAGFEFDGPFDHIDGQEDFYRHGTSGRPSKGESPWRDWSNLGDDFGDWDLPE